MVPLLRVVFWGAVLFLVGEGGDRAAAAARRVGKRGKIASMTFLETPDAMYATLTIYTESK